MGERKVLNKYYPPDFDPAKIPKRKRPKNEQIKIRMMLPMSIRCNTCGTYIYKGTKFNSRKEDVVGETYLGIQIFRFYFKCTKCSAELTMKTDPQNSDYVVESGASRNFEPWRKEDETTENLKMKRMEEEMGDAMKTLENKALDSKTDMDILNALEEMKSMKTRHETVSFESMLAALNRPSNEKEKQMIEEVDEADEALIKSIVFHNSKDFVRRIQDDEDEDIYDDVCQLSSKSIKHNFKEKIIVGNPTDSLTTASLLNTSRNADGGSSAHKPKFIVKPRNRANSSEKPQTVQGSQNAQESQSSQESFQCAPKEGSQSAQKEQAKGSESIDALQSLCANYDDDSEE